MEQLKDQIAQVLFELVQDIKIHQIDINNSIFEVDYDTYIKQIIYLINQKSGSN